MGMLARRSITLSSHIMYNRVKSGHDRRCRELGSASNDAVCLVTERAVHICMNALNSSIQCGKLC